MVCDFFHPRVGGVETHIWSLSQALLRLGHKVVVVTHCYGEHGGVQQMPNGLKVYYLPLVPFWRDVTLPTFFLFLPIFREICVYESIGIIHAHSIPSSLAAEAILCGQTMGLKLVYTDHSLYGEHDLASIHVNALLKWALAAVDRVVAVSKACAQSLCTRCDLRDTDVTVIPNAVDAGRFYPAAHAAGNPLVEAGPTLGPGCPVPKQSIGIIVLSRLTHRKGVGLLAEVLPLLCRRFPEVRIVIGGDGPKRKLLETARAKHGLQNCVYMVGEVDPGCVRELLHRGQILLNCSLTESFGITLLEAAACGLLTVSTNVGGIPDVLPRDMAILAPPEPEALVNAVGKAIDRLETVDPHDFHKRVSEAYSWEKTAKMTEQVYEASCRCEQTELADRFLRCLRRSSVFGVLLCMIAAALHVELLFLEWIRPRPRAETLSRDAFGSTASKVLDKVVQRPQQKEEM